jgi:hypothetical protein
MIARNFAVLVLLCGPSALALSGRHLWQFDAVAGTEEGCNHEPECLGCSLGEWENGIIDHRADPPACAFTAVGVPHDGHCGFTQGVCGPQDTATQISNCWFEWEITVVCPSEFAANTGPGHYPNCYNGTPPPPPGLGPFTLQESGTELGQCMSSVFARTFAVYTDAQCNGNTGQLDGTITFRAKCADCYSTEH